MSTITIILEGMGGELERATIEQPEPENRDDFATSDAIGAVIENWILSPGDTIRIVEGST